MKYLIVLMFILTTLTSYSQRRIFPDTTHLTSIFDKVAVKSQNSLIATRKKKLHVFSFYDNISFNKPLDTLLISDNYFHYEIEVKGRFALANFNRRDPWSLIFDVKTDSNSLVLGEFQNLSLDFTYLSNGPHYSKIEIKRSKINFLQLSANNRSVEIKNSSIDTLYLGRAEESNDLSIFESKIDAIFSLFYVPDTIKLMSVDFTSLKGQVDFTKATSLVLYIGQTDFSKIKFDLANSTVYPHELSTHDEASKTYQWIMKLCADGGYTAKYEEYDKRYQESVYLYNGHYFLNFVSKYWWDYGYDKGRVFYISVSFFVIFVLLNLIFQNKIRSVYWPKSFKKYDSTLSKRGMPATRIDAMKLQFDRSLAISLYTAYLFWGIKLDLKELELKHRWIVLLIIFQYITGNCLSRLLG